MGADGFMTENVKKVSSMKKFLSVALIAVTALLLSLQVFAPLKANASSYYDDNRAKVEVIDAGAVNFKALDDGDLEDKDENMQAIVTVATAVNAFIADYDQKDYFSADWTAITKQFDLCKNYFKVSGSSADGNNYYGNYKNFLEGDAYAERINGYRAVADGFKTKLEKYEEYKLENEQYFDDKKAEMLKVNELNPDAAPNQKVGVYDENAIEALDALVAIGQIFTEAAGPRVIDGTIDYAASIEELDLLKAATVQAMLAVPKNDVERAVSLMNDYKAIDAGDEEGDAQVAKEEALEGIALGKAFLADASDEVKNYYKQALTDMLVFEEGGEAEDLSDLDDKAKIESEDGVVTITAYVNGAEANVFPHNATVKINDNTGSVYSINLDNAIAKDDRNISVAYCMDIDIYAGSALWDGETSIEDGEIEYVVKVDLSKYYSEKVANKSSWFTDLLEKIGIKLSAPADMLEAVEKCSNRITAGKSEGSLCYHYAGKGVVEKLEASIDGTVLTFKTKSFSNFAVTKAGGRSVLYNPLFWLIVLLAIIVCFLIVAIILKSVRYKITFDSNGGSKVAPVKAKKDEYFILPANPTKEGCSFGGWYEDKELKVRFIDTRIVKRGSKTVYAKWGEPLTADQIDDFYKELRAKLASNAKMGGAYEVKAGEKVRLAKLVKEDSVVNLYLALDPKAVLADGTCNVAAANGEEFAETPLLKAVDGKEAFDEAVALIDLLIAQYDLNGVEPVIEDEAALSYVLEFVGEEVANEPAADETEKVEEVEEPAEVEKEPATEEELCNYYNEIRAYVKGFALAEEREDLDRDATWIKVFLREESVDVYLKIEAEKVGAEKAEDVFAEETPAVVKVCDDETLEAAKKAIKVLMEEIGLVETGESVDLGDSESRSFGYKLKFEE